MFTVLPTTFWTEGFQELFSKFKDFSMTFQIFTENSRILTDNTGYFEAHYFQEVYKYWLFINMTCTRKLLSQCRLASIQNIHIMLKNNHLLTKHTSIHMMVETPVLSTNWNTSCGLIRQESGWCIENNVIRLISKRLYTCERELQTRQWYLWNFPVTLDPESCINLVWLLWYF